MAWVINVLVLCTTVVLAMAVMELFYGGRVFVQARLDRIGQARLAAGNKEDELLKQSFLARVVRPAFAALGNALGRLTPGEIKQKTEQKLVYAGNPANLDANSFSVMRLLAGILFFAGGVALSVLAGVEGVRAVFMTALFASAGMIIPAAVLNAKVKKCQSEIQKVLPDMLDLLLVSVEAGLSFDMALKRVSEQKKGRLSFEISRILEEIRLGKVREEALRSLVRRTGVRDLSTFVGAIIQSERLGTNLAGTLRIQAESIRLKRKQRVEEAARKAPIKMLFPMVFLIFPALFVVLLGPTVVRVIEMFLTYF